MIAFDLGAGGFDQAVIFHARRTGCETRHAAQAIVHVIHKSRAQWNLPLQRHFHEVNAPSRRIHLFVPESISRTGRQAESAMHAIGDEVWRWRMMGIKATRTR